MDRFGLTGDAAEELSTSRKAVAPNVVKNSLNTLIHRRLLRLYVAEATILPRERASATHQGFGR